MALQRSQNTTAFEEKSRKRQSSADLVPKLDLSKAHQFANLPDPYAYLREEEENLKAARA